MVVNQAMLVSTYRKQGRADRAAEALAQVEARLSRALPHGHIAFMAISSHRSFLARQRGDVRAALAYANKAVQILETSINAGKQGKPHLPLVLVRRADIELDLHENDAAAADAHAARSEFRTALDHLRDSLGDDHPDTVRARRLLEADRPDEAR